MESSSILAENLVNPLQDEQLANQNDSLYILPLQILPLRSSILKSARMTKNSRLDTVIEIFSSANTGQGQINIDEIQSHYNNNVSKNLESDVKLLEKLENLNSFDVYSLRICLRNNGIKVVSGQFLNLSDNKKHELKEYMKSFTEPLIRQIYGKNSINIDSMEDIINVLSKSDLEEAMQNLQKIASVLNIKIRDIPNFIENFSDVYLSVSYFKQNYKEIEHLAGKLGKEISSLKDNWEMKNFKKFQEIGRKFSGEMKFLLSVVDQLLEEFSAITEDMWSDITPEKFKLIEENIRSSHHVVGGILCGVGSKVNSWNSRFPKSYSGGPLSRAEFIMSDIAPGMEKILALAKQG